MKHKINGWQWAILAFLVMWSLYSAYPLRDRITTDANGKKTVEKGKLTLGIDLQGGYQILLEVDPAKIPGKEGNPPTSSDLAEAQARAIEVLRNRIDGLGNKEIVLYPEPGSTRIVLQIPGVGDEDRLEIEKMLSEPAYLQFRVVHPDSDEEVQKLIAENKAPPGYVIEAVQGTNEAGVQISTTVLRKVEDPGFEALSPLERRKQILADREAVRMFEYKPGFELLLEDEIINKIRYFRPVYVRQREDMNGSYISRAFVGSDEYGRPQVDMEFNNEGGSKFGELTEKLARDGQEDRKVRRLAIVLDGRLYSSPTVKNAIPGGRANISGTFSYDEARKLAIALSAGALPAPVNTISLDRISPTLGSDSIRSGINASMYAAIVVVVFMLAYYLKAGVIATLALGMGILLLPLGAVVSSGFLNIFSTQVGGDGAGLPTLTLPGLAGLVLTIGMMVDANVLIYERIREELANGKRLVNAIQAGFDRAFSAILDANVTTLISAVVLFLYGTGAVRGFAVTLIAGLIVGVYVALVFTRLMFDLLARINPDGKLRMLQFFGKTSINFLKYAKPATILSSILVVAGLAHMAMNGRAALGVDFTGGSSLSFEFSKQRVDIKDLRDALAAAGVGESIIQYRTDLATGKEILEVSAGEAESAKILQTVQALDGYANTSSRVIGSQVGKEMVQNGIMALCLALLGIVAYVSLRYEFAFAIGAILAVFHDAIVAIAVYAWLDRPINLVTIAAILTIVGYSVNDTIVIFDRIREDMKLKRNLPIAQVCNIALNETLSRTIITSLTTLFSCLVLVFFGGGAIHDFATIMLVGIIAGTYSTIYIATPVMLFFRKEKGSTNAVKPLAS